MPFTGGNTPCNPRMAMVFSRATCAWAIYRGSVTLLPDDVLPLRGSRMASADATQTARKDLIQSTIYGGKTIVKYLIHEAH